MQETEPRALISRRSLLVCGSAFAVTGGGWWALYRYRPKHDGGHLTVAQAYAQAISGAILLVDIRTPGEWRQTGVPEGAVPLDMRSDDFMKSLQSLTEQTENRPIALICAGGVRSARLSRQLLAAGFEQIIDIPEGIYGSAAGPGWLKSNLPVRPWNG